MQEISNILKLGLESCPSAGVNHQISFTGGQGFSNFSPEQGQKPLSALSVTHASHIVLLKSYLGRFRQEIKLCDPQQWKGFELRPMVVCIKEYEGAHGHPRGSTRQNVSVAEQQTQQ